MELKDLEYNILKSELELVQKQVDKFDDMSLRIKTWAVTLWIASIGWFLQSKDPSILKWAAVAILLFWIFDAMNKVYREDYKNRRTEIAAMLAQMFKGEKSAGEAMKLPKHSMTDIPLRMLMPHIGLMYAVLIFISLMLRYKTF